MNAKVLVNMKITDKLNAMKIPPVTAAPLGPAPNLGFEWMPIPVRYDKNLDRRHSAALRALRRQPGFIPADLLLSYVVWPTAAIEAALEAFANGGPPPFRVADQEALV